MSEKKRPNILLIIMDCLRADQLGCYGQRPSPTPALDKLAQQACLVEQTISHGPRTRPAMPSLFSSAYPSEYGGVHIYGSERPSLVEDLARQGYRTAAFVPNPWLSPTFGYDRGIAHFDECTPRPRWGQSLPLRALHHLLSWVGAGLLCPPYLNAAEVTERALGWLTDAAQPFFLWVHYMDVHWPYHLRRCRLFLPTNPQTHYYTAGFARKSRQHPERVTEREREGLLALYHSGARFATTQAGRLLEALRDQDRIDNTLVIVTADHGEAFGEHGQFYHRYSLYEENVHVPLLLKLPGQRESRRIGGGPAQLMDIAPTVLEVAGLPPNERFQGQSLHPALSTGQALPEREVFCEGGHASTWIIAVRTTRWKGIVHLDRATMQVQGVEWYDLEHDPNEQKNRADAVPALTAQLKERVLDYAARVRQPVIEEPEMDPEVVERLKGLGYLGD